MAYISQYEYYDNNGNNPQDKDPALSLYEIFVTKIYDKFFEIKVDNDLPKLKSFLLEQYKKIENGQILKNDNQQPTPWDSSGSITTSKWNKYNVFQFYSPEIYNLLKSVKTMAMEACNYYNIDFEKEQYWIQGWFNVNYNHIGKLDWHEHGGNGAPWFHGYYCVEAEPSITNYKVFENKVERHNKNNYAIYNRYALCILANNNTSANIPNSCITNSIEFFGYMPNNNTYNYSNFNVNFTNNPILLGNKSIYPRVYCIDETGRENEAITVTLCDAIWELRGRPLLELKELISSFILGKYQPVDQELPDMSINDKFIWVRPPLANKSEICISNENIQEYSIDDGLPQYFNFEQFNTVCNVVEEFENIIIKHGKENLLGIKIEIDFP